MVSYIGLETLLKEKSIGKTELSSELGLSTRTVAKIAKGENLSKNTLKKIADYLNVTPENLYRIESDNKILQMLRDEKEIHLPGGLYHELQIRMTYNSNHIEGSKLSEDQTRLIFETNTINMGDGIPCTIRFTERDGNIPECNFVNKVEQFTQEFSDDLSGIKESLDNCIAGVEEILKSKKAPTKAEKEAILNTLKKARQSIGSNANYMCDCFAEQMDKTVKEAKGEIESFMQHRVHTFAANTILEQAKNNPELLTEGISNPIEVE